MNIHINRTGGVRIVVGVVLHVGTVLAALAAYPAPGAAQIRLSEVLCAPTEDYDLDGEVDTKSDEFVEVVNVSDAPVALDDWYVRDGTGDAYHYGFSGNLPVGGTLVVTGTMAQVWQSNNDAGTSGLSLNNTGDIVELWYAPADAEPSLIDVVTVPPHAASAGRSLAWDPAIDDYVLHDGLAPYGGSAVPAGNGCPPGPGVPGTCNVSVPTRTIGFGPLKAAYDR